MHLGDISWIRRSFIDFDARAGPIMGIRDWDDAVCVDVGGEKLLMSCDGPYKKRLVMLSALAHAATDVIVKGGLPLYALDALAGAEEDIRDMVESLRVQGSFLNIPILGGNTIRSETPSATLFIVGKLLLQNPIRDSGAMEGDLLLLLGDPIWGSRDERMEKAQRLFSCWWEVLKKARINASKDVTKGGLITTVAEIASHSNLDYELNDLSLPKYRNLDNFLIAVSRDEFPILKEIADSFSCPLLEVGSLTKGHDSDTTKRRISSRPATRQLRRTAEIKGKNDI